MAMTSRKYAPGEAIFTQGEHGHEAYILRKGSVAILHRDASGNEAAIAFRGPGEMVGEMALATRERRMATVRAESACTVAVLTRDEIEDRMTDADPILQVVLQTAFARLRELVPR